MDGMDKTGGKYENAIEDAIIAMNEPKDASVQAIRDYLGMGLFVLVELIEFVNLLLMTEVVVANIRLVSAQFAQCKHSV